MCVCVCVNGYSIVSITAERAYDVRDLMSEEGTNRGNPSIWHVSSKSINLCVCMCTINIYLYLYTCV